MADVFHNKCHATASLLKSGTYLIIPYCLKFNLYIIAIYMYEIHKHYLAAQIYNLHITGTKNYHVTQAIVQMQE